MPHEEPQKTANNVPTGNNAVSDVVAHSVPAHTADDPEKASRPVLVIDIGGTKVKMLVTGKTTPRKAATGRAFTPERLVQIVRSLEPDWAFAAVTIGFPGLVGAGGPKSEPGNLGPGWVGFDFASALATPVKIVNDAVMQALGSYDKGRMVFLGLGTGIGSALIDNHVIVPLELSHLRYDSKRSINDVLSRAGLRRSGKKVWRRCIDELVPTMLRAFVADYLVLGGGNAKLVKDLPVGARLGHNRAAFRGGFRLWEKDDAWTLALTDSEPAKSEPIGVQDHGQNAASEQRE